MTRKWKDSGTVEEARKADDGTENSFIIRLDTGGETLRHKGHLRHNTAAMPAPLKKVNFNLPARTPTVAKEPGVVTRSRANSA